MCCFRWCLHRFLSSPLTFYIRHPFATRTSTSATLLLAGLTSILISTVFNGLALSADREWDRILEGETKFPAQSSGFFANKSLDLDHNEFLAEKDLLRRPLAPSTISFVFAIVTACVMVSHMLIMTFFSYKKNEPNKRIKSIHHLVSTATLYFCIFLVLLTCFGYEGWTTAENSKNYVALISTFYSRLQRDAKDHDFPKKQNYATTPFATLDETLFMMDIIGICVKSSLHYFFLEDKSSPFPIPLLDNVTLIDGMVYDSESLTELRFCQEEGYKVVGVTFGILASLFCFVIGCVTAFWLRNTMKFISSSSSLQSRTETGKGEEDAQLGDIFNTYGDPNEKVGAMSSSRLVIVSPSAASSSRGLTTSGGDVPPIQPPPPKKGGTLAYWFE
ncbi:uncharacterized protein LOC110848688 [Folsomia candida]|uniref:uncharacterized protein LOC110848688 n=1 Tax=Folsomia candida TaxID=158441 RepID=UPI000B906BA5|nr:uncharacterized protein LOC110848688 [Folsomia candida]XP_035706794.1 uncharacterized protein LOC110848688 [Folsomia candida]XP_035706795.1 uncharacterized protein LOC110848688 [Folsomia candida]XP_035706796.1 uncharacterized protein LOC110848688 [Folsomia candida]